MRNEVRNLESVLTQFGVDPARSVVVPIPGGFSGAGVWRVSYGDREFALKRWPKGQPAHLTLRSMHAAMSTARDAGLTFVPVVVSARPGENELSWDLVTWMPGAPVETISHDQLRAAVQALSQLHASWRTPESRHDVCTAVRLQLGRLGDWTAGELEELRVGVGRDVLMLRAYHQWITRRERASRKLQHWTSRKLPLQHCLGDVWSSHVLFTGSEVTGIVDYGGMRQDHPAQDLARLLGSYPLTPEERSFAIELYPQRTADLEDLVPLLIETGRVVMLGNWLRWLVLERRTFADPTAVFKRLERLISQCEQASI